MGSCAQLAHVDTNGIMFCLVSALFLNGIEDGLGMARLCCSAHLLQRAAGATEACVGVVELERISAHVSCQTKDSAVVCCMGVDVRQRRGGAHMGHAHAAVRGPRSGRGLLLFDLPRRLA